MKNHAKVDIVVLVYNNETILRRFFEYLYKNTSDFNLIVVDNGSKDSSKQIVKQYQKKENNINIIQNSKNRGVAGGRNDGLKSGSAEYCCCLDSDQFVYFGWLEELFTIHEKGYTMVGVDAWQMHPPTYKMRPYFPKKRCQSKFDRFIYLGGGGTLTPRKIFEELNYFDENYNLMFFEDSDFSFAASKKGYKLMWHYGNKILHLGHQTIGKDSSKTKYFQDSYRYFVKKWMPYFPQPVNALILERMLPEIFERKQIK